MKKVFFSFLFLCFFFLMAQRPAHADWVECQIRVTDPGDGMLTGAGTSQTLSSASHEYVGVKTNCSPDSNGIKVQFQTSTPANIYFQNAYGSFAYHSFSGTSVDSYILTNPNDLLSLTPGSPAGLIFGNPGVVPVTYTHFQMFYWAPSSSPSSSPSPSPTPTPTPIASSTPLPSPQPSMNPSSTGVISVSPATNSVTVGVPFTVDVAVNGGGQALNAAQATIGISSNLSITGLRAPVANACNFQYTQVPSVTDPSFAGAVVNGSTPSCTAMTLVLTPKSAGAGTITITNGSIKSFTDSSEIFSSAVNGSFQIVNQSSAVNGLAPKSFLLNSYPFDTYSSTLTLTGTKDSSLTHILLNESESGVSYQTATTWQANIPSLASGNNTLTFYGKDDSGNKTAAQSIIVNRHALGDIDGDGVVDIVDASLFAVDWGKKGNLTYSLSDMNGDGVVDLTDFSILAKHEVAL